MGLPIFFARHFSGCPQEIEQCARQNVVLHAKMHVCPFKGSLRAKLTRGSTALVHPEHFSSANPDSQFRHCRYNMAAYGKVLAFRSADNLIRAGKSSHADALTSCLLFLRWSGTTTWPARINAPNMVVSGKLKERPPTALRTHPQATHSMKFPGIALRLPCHTTTEIYESGAFIVPGVTSPQQLQQALNDLVEVVRSVQ